MSVAGDPITRGPYEAGAASRAASIITYLRARAMTLEAEGQKAYAARDIVIACECETAAEALREAADKIAADEDQQVPA